MSQTSAATVAWLLACPLLSKAKFTSTFALLDVKHGRRHLAARMKRLGDLKQSGVPVVIVGRIQPGTGGIGRDDGESREFSLDVDHVFEIIE